MIIKAYTLLERVTCKVVNNYDGDTVKVLPQIPPLDPGFFGSPVTIHARKVSIRLAFADTPEKTESEKRGISADEAECGKLCQEYVESLINSKIQVRVIGIDKYGGRLDGMIWFREGGAWKSLATRLLELQLAAEMDEKGHVIQIGESL